MKRGSLVCNYFIHHGRVLFLCKLRGYENIIEALPFFFANSAALTLLGYPGVATAGSIFYGIGKGMYGIGYAEGPLKRLPGLLMSDLFYFAFSRALIAFALLRHFWA